jgi:hypothetical protein
MYAYGRGVPKDRIQAYVWLSLAGQHGIGSALKTLDSMVKMMSSEEKVEAMKLFDQWRNRTADQSLPPRIEPIPV